MTQSLIAVMLMWIVPAKIMKNILAVSCTSHSKDRRDSLMVYKSLNLLKHEIDLRIIYDNKRGLPEVYNEYISAKYAKKYDILLFIHDDVYVDDLKIRGKLYEAIKQYDIVGVAGCLYPIIRKPALWHLMSDRLNHRGYVAHVNPQDIATINMTTFGPTPSRVAVIDGLFMAINLKSVLNSEWKFDEDFKYHHYDLSSCLYANEKNLKIGVTPINIIHASSGLSSISNPDFTESQDIFISKHHAK